MRQEQKDYAGNVVHKREEVNIRNSHKRENKAWNFPIRYACEKRGVLERLGIK